MSDKPDSRSVSKRRCKALTKKGEPCKAVVVLDSGYCIAHDRGAEIVELRRDGHVAGGYQSSNLAAVVRALKADPSRQELYEKLSAAMVQVFEGTMPPNRGNSLASLGRAVLAVIDSAEQNVRLSKVEELVEGIVIALQSRGVMLP